MNATVSRTPFPTASASAHATTVPPVSPGRALASVVLDAGSATDSQEAHALVTRDASDAPRTPESRVARALEVLDHVPDPEIPTVSLRDLGIVREVHCVDDSLHVVLTPTYSGCPATELIESLVREALDAAGLGPVRIELRRAPAWTTDWITERGRLNLLEAGIVPPTPARADGAIPIRFHAPRVDCPRCGSRRTETLSRFGSTACKSLHRCLDCREPFERFKPI